MFEINKDVVFYNGQKIEIRGLSMQDLAILYKDNREDLVKVYDFFKSNQSGDNVEVSELGSEFIFKFGKFAVFLIALAADEPDRAGEFSKLPFPVQLQMLLSIYNLTIEDSGGLDNFLSMAVLLTRGATSLIKKGQPAQPVKS